MLYFENDVRLLIDIFQSYIDKCKEAYDNNPP